MYRKLSAAETMDDLMFGEIFVKYVDFFKIYSVLVCCVVPVLVSVVFI